MKNDRWLGSCPVNGRDPRMESDPKSFRTLHPLGCSQQRALKDVPVPWSATKNTIRLNTSDPVNAAVLTSKTLWQSTNEHSRPQTVILVDAAQWSIAAVSVDLTRLAKGRAVCGRRGIPKETLEERGG